MSTAPTSTLLETALARHRAGDLRAALDGYRQVLALEPDHVEALNLFGAAAAQAGDVPAGLAALERACRLAPEHATAQLNRGMVLAAVGRLDEALPALRVACERAPTLVQAWTQRALASARAGAHAEAREGWQRVLQLQPGHAGALFQLGLALQHLGQPELALQRYAEASAATPGGLAAAHNNRGSLLLQAGQVEAALAEFERAVRIDPAHPDALNNQGAAWALLQRHDAALPCFEKALALRPDHRHLAGRVLHSALQVADWRDFELRRTQIREQLTRGVEAAAPFVVVTAFDEPAVQQQAAALHAARLPQVPALPPLPRGPRIRLGYFSADLHDHATAHLMAGVFEQHDRAAFELHAFSFGPAQEDPMRQRLRAAFEHFHDVREQPPEAIAALARSLKLDLAIDLKGYTRDARPALFAHRAAPVQINYLGYPGTLGAPFIDYLIADATLFPIPAAAQVSEKILRLPGCYQANDDRRPVPAPPPARAALGLPPLGFVFASFNALYKCTPAQFALWMEILRQCPGSVLWLLESGPAAAQHLSHEAARQGVAPDRLVWAPNCPPDQHLARLGAADLFLDSLPCNAHTTASDALWAGLPLLTRAGRSMAGRVAASLLRALDLDALVCESAEQYVETAVALCHQPAKLAALRERLVQARRKPGGPFDTRATTRALEQAYRWAHERAQAGLPPAPFDVERS